MKKIQLTEEDDMEPWIPFIIMSVFTIFTAILAFVAGALKRGEE